MDLFTLVARLGMDSSEYERGISKARGSFSELGNQIGAKAVAIGNMVSRAVEKAVDIAADLGKSAIQNAADVTAEKAQFKATFGELQGSAEKAFKDIEKSTGVFGTRLKNVGTKAFSQFKGAGLDGVDALSMMTDYTNLAADAASYYDISLEDADARLRSFLRGNTEAGDAIGLFTSESQRNSAAMEKYGQKWQALTEAQKQMLMLDISKDIYQQSGAIGQAARESDAWTNVVGNLKEVWRQATALIGAPIISAITPVIQEITTFLQNEGVQTKLTQFGLTIASVASATFKNVMDFIDKLMTPGTDENSILVGISEFAGTIKTVAGLAFDKIMGFLGLLIGGPDGMSDTITNIGTFLTDVGTFIDTYAGPISTLIGVVMGFWAITNPFAILIGALVVLAANWQDVKEWTDKTLTKVRIFFQTTYNDKISPILSGIAGWFDTIWGKIDAAISKWKEFIGYQDGTASDPTKTSKVQSGAMGSYAGGSTGTGTVSSYAAGASIQNNAGGMFYTKNNYVSRMHEGEAILNSREAAEWRAGKTGNAGASAAEIASAVAQALDGAFVDMDKEHVGRLILPTVSRGMAQDMYGRRYAHG